MLIYLITLSAELDAADLALKLEPLPLHASMVATEPDSGLFTRSSLGAATTTGCILAVSNPPKNISASGVCVVSRQLNPITHMYQQA